MTFPIQIDREKWGVFRDAVKANGSTLRAVVESLIDGYIEQHQRRSKPRRPNGEK